MNTQNFLDGLDKLTFVKYEDKTLHTAEGFEISHELKLMDTMVGSYPIQFLFRVRKDDVYVMTWGCSCNDDNKLASIWWLKKCYAIESIENEERYVKETLAKEQFKNLTK